MPQVAGKETHYSGASSYIPAAGAALKALGVPTKTARLLIAHSCVSSRYGTKMKDYNPAGIKASANYAGYWASWIGFEEDPSGKRTSATMRWRVYSSLKEGYADMIRILKGSRYKSAYAYLVAGDTTYFSQVGYDGWYTANVEETAASMRAMLPTVDKYLKLPLPSASFPVAQLSALGLIGVALYKILTRR